MWTRSELIALYHHARHLGQTHCQSRARSRCEARTSACARTRRTAQTAPERTAGHFDEQPCSHCPEAEAAASTGPAIKAFQRAAVGTEWTKNDCMWYS